MWHKFHENGRFRLILAFDKPVVFYNIWMNHILEQVALMSQLGNELFIFVCTHDFDGHIRWQSALDLGSDAAFPGFELWLVHAFENNAESSLAESFTANHISQFLLQLDFCLINSTLRLV